MADPERRGGSGWTAFLAGIVLVAVLGWRLRSPQRNSAMSPISQIDMPDVTITPPELIARTAAAPQCRRAPKKKRR